MSEKNTQTEKNMAQMDEKVQNKSEIIVESSAEVSNNDVEETTIEINADNEEAVAMEISDEEIEKALRGKTEEEVVKKKKEDRKKAVKVLLSKTSEEDKKVSDKEKMEALMDVAMATEELRQLKKEHGIEDEPVGKRGKIARKFSNWFGRKENEEMVAVNKKKYIWMALFLGWFGAHRFYVKHYRVGLLYLLLCWSGIGFYNAVVDILIAIPMKPDENGNIML